MLIGFPYFREPTHQPRYVSHKVQTFYYCVSLSCIVQIYILTVTIVSRKYWDLSVQVKIGEYNCSIPSKQQPFNHDGFSKILRASTALQSRLFLKIIENFMCKQKLVNNCTIPSMHAEKKIPIILINTLLLHIPLLALTDRRNDRWRNEYYTRCAWAGGTFFPFVLLCQFLVLAGNRFWFYILTYLEYNTVMALCLFFGSGGKQFLVLRMYLVYNTVVRLRQFFGCGRKQFSK